MITVWLGVVGRRRKVQPKIRSRHRHGDLAYFSEYLRDHTPNEAFKYFILSSSYNFNPDLAAVTVQGVKNAEKDGKKHPEMLNRVMSVLLHPFIRLGYGFEFGIPGQVAEDDPGFSILNYPASALNRGRPRSHCGPRRRPDGACTPWSFSNLMESCTFTSDLACDVCD